MAKYTNLTDEDCENLWENVDKLINVMNASNTEHRLLRNGNKRFIRQEQYSQFLYCAAVYPKETPTDGYSADAREIVKYMIDNELVFLIIGNTAYRTVPGKRSIRSEDVASKSKKRWNESRPVFDLPIDYNETRYRREVEILVRKKLGVLMKKDICKTLGLDVPTKCVITTKKRCEEVQEVVKNNAGAVLSTLLITDTVTQEDRQLLQKLQNLIKGCNSLKKHTETEEIDNIEGGVSQLSTGDVQSSQEKTTPRQGNTSMISSGDKGDQD